MNLQTRDRASQDVAPVPDRQSGVPLPGPGGVKAAAPAHPLSRLGKTIPPTPRQRLLPLAVGPVLRRNSGYRRYRENPALAGPDTCTQRRIDRIYTGVDFNPR